MRRFRQANGDTYAGQWFEDKVEDCEFCEFISCKTTHSEDSEALQAHGHGKFQHSDGSSYEGEWNMAKILDSGERSKLEYLE